MRYRFHAKAAGNVLMLESAADAVLTRTDTRPRVAGADADVAGERHVPLRQRAGPLMGMIKRSLAANMPIIRGAKPPPVWAGLVR